jgi:putative transposase
MVGKTGFEEVRPLFEATFREFGLPRAIRTDNGPPFASVGLEGLSRLSVWWIRLGIRHDRIRPGKPQDNGRHERMHRTLKAETTRPPRQTARAQQKVFDRFRLEFNRERPHEALDYATPASLYAPSALRFARRLPELLAYPDEWRTRKVKTAGQIKWRGRVISVSQALAGERIGLEAVGQGRWLLHFGAMPIGILDEQKWTVESLNGKRKGKR